MTKTMNFYWTIQPNATAQLNAQLRMRVDGSALNSELGRTVNMSRLTWMYWNTTKSGWDNATSSMTQDGYLVCNTNHFSTWAVAEVEPATVVPDTFWLMYGGIGAVVVAITAIVIYLVRRR